jgi:hypothetical protein
MRFNVAGSAVVAAALGGIFLLSACTPAARKSESLKPAPQPREVYTPTPPPTVPPPASTDFPTPKPKVTPKVGAGGRIEPIGPDITFLGITRADGKAIDPTTGSDGIPVFRNYVGSGFQLVVEGKPGASGVDVGRRVFVSEATDPKKRPDLEVQVDRPLGNGSEVVCDRIRPNIGGVPAINPPSFAETQKVADTLNDMGCRFEVFLESDSSCTLGPNEDWQFRDAETKIQFCMTVARAWNFPIGETLVTVRLRDTAGNYGPVKKIRINRPKDAPTPRPRPQPTPTSKGLPVRP